MKRLIYAAAAAMIVLTVFAFVGCTPAGSGDTETISISASAGKLTGSGTSWAFDAGSVPQDTTETITFTVTNTTALDFLATGSQAFTPSDDFTDSIGVFYLDVAANSTNTFTGGFSPTGTLDSPETGTLTLTPSTGSPITITLRVTPVGSFVVQDPSLTPITPTVQGQLPYGSTQTFTITNNSPTATITLTGAPNYVTISGVGYSVYSQPVDVDLQPTNSIPPNGGSVTFDIQDTNSSGGNIGTINIMGADSTNNASFSFTGSIFDYQNAQ
jgi:hypothetical protein